MQALGDECAALVQQAAIDTRHEQGSIEQELIMFGRNMIGVLAMPIRSNSLGEPRVVKSGW